MERDQPRSCLAHRRELSISFHIHRSASAVREVLRVVCDAMDSSSQVLVSSFLLGVRVKFHGTQVKWRPCFPTPYIPWQLEQRCL